MKFYLARQADGPPRILVRKDEALKIDKTAEAIDVPVDQEGLRCAMQDFFNRVYELEQQVLEQPLPATPKSPENWPPPNCEGEDIKDWRDPGDPLPDQQASLNPVLLEEQVVALGAAGADGLTLIAGNFDRTGVSAMFARGVCLLNVLASDEHALANVFLRQRRQKQRQFA